MHSDCDRSLADGNASLASWLASREEVKHVFGRQALGMVWDFAAVDMRSEATRSWSVRRTMEEGIDARSGEIA